MTCLLSAYKAGRRPLVRSIAGVMFLVFAGCADYQVRMPDSDPINERFQNTFVNAYVWGMWYDPQVVMARCESRALNDVVVKRNYLHDLASVFTFGLWMPTSIDYRCKAPAADVGSFPEAPKPRP